MKFNNKLLAALIVIILLGGGLTIAQIWYPLLGWDIYFKAIGTLVILLLIIALIMVLKSDFGGNKDLKDKNYLD